MGKRAKSNTPRSKTTSNPRSKATSNTPRSDVIDDYLKRLEGAALNRDKFTAVYGDLAADTENASKLEMVNIARDYVKGYKARSAPREAALKKIEREFIRRVRYKNERESAKK
jgi:hypothetical protein